MVVNNLYYLLTATFTKLISVGKESVSCVDLCLCGVSHVVSVVYFCVSLKQLAVLSFKYIFVAESGERKERKKRRFPISSFILLIYLFLPLALSI